MDIEAHSESGWNSLIPATPCHELGPDDDPLNSLSGPTGRILGNSGKALHAVSIPERADSKINQ